MWYDSWAGKQYFWLYTFIGIAYPTGLKSPRWPDEDKWVSDRLPDENKVKLGKRRTLYHYSDTAS